MKLISLILIVLLGFSHKTSATNNYIVSLDNTGYVVLQSLSDTSLKKLFHEDEFSKYKDWNDINIIEAKWQNDEKTLLKIIIRYVNSTYFSYKSYVIIYVFDISQNKLIFKQKFLDPNKQGYRERMKTGCLRFELLIGDTNSSYFIKKLTFSKFSDEYIDKLKTECIDGYYYYLHGDIWRSKCENQKYASEHMRKDIIVLKKQEYLPNFAMIFQIQWGFYRDIEYNSNNNKLLYVFVKKRYFFYRKKTSIAEVREFYLNTKEQKIIADFAFKPSYSNDGNLILYEKTYALKFKLYRSEGFYIYDSLSKESRLYKNCKTAKFVN